MNKVLSVRLPQSVRDALLANASRVRCTPAALVAGMIGVALDRVYILVPLEDCRLPLDSKLDVRIPVALWQSLHAVCQEQHLFPSLLLRKLLFHLYVSRKVQFVKEGGRYTLAARHD